MSETTRPEYVRALNRVEDVPTKDGRTVGALNVQSITPRAVDKIFAAVQKGPRGRRVRQANIPVNVARRAWDVVRRLYPKTVPADNPGDPAASRHADLADSWSSWASAPLFDGLRGRESAQDAEARSFAGVRDTRRLQPRRHD